MPGGVSGSSNGPGMRIETCPSACLRGTGGNGSPAPVGSYLPVGRMLIRAVGQAGAEVQFLQWESHMAEWAARGIGQDR